jgi:cellulose synthase operon protein C
VTRKEVRSQESRVRRAWVALLLCTLPIAAQTADPAHCAALRHHGDPEAAKCYQQLTRSSDPGIAAEGYWGVHDFQRANEFFRDAVKAHPKDPNLRVRWGVLFLDHWHSDVKDMPTAQGLFQEALELKPDYAPALLGMARIAAESFDSKAAELAEKALKSDPKLVEAQELLARVALEDNNPQKAEAEANKALAISPEALDAMSILATIDWLNDNKSSPWIDKILKINPTYAEAYETAGHFFVINRRYDDGILAYRKALEIKPELSSARSELGINLMRLGDDVEARQQLEECWQKGFQSTSTKNSLTLLDSYKNFVTYRTPTTIIRLHKKEAMLLKPYVESEMQRALATYEKKYKFKLGGPVQLEVYPDHEDFAVRTMGMPGIGAVGVTFVATQALSNNETGAQKFTASVAIDSPSARPPGQFHWDSTMWHELSHVYVLAMTNSRVPRWFTEGLAVYEETGNGHPDWGDRLDPEDIHAIKTHQLLPIADLDRGFIHPTYPAQVTVSYFQGGKICEFIAKKWGYDKLLAMIEDFKNLNPTVDVVQSEFQMKPEEFDKQFLAWLDDSTKVTVNGFEDWKKQLLEVSAAAKQKNWDKVIAEGTPIRDVYSDYVEAGSVYEFLANAYLAKNDKPKATAQLARYAEVGGRDAVLLKQLATLQDEAGDKQAAARTLERLDWIYLKDEEAHKKLAGLDMDLKDYNGAIREWGAVIAGGTVDPAGAHYQLARALNAVHRSDEAKDEVLASLEVAPDFKPAQKLLLELSEKE